MRTCRAEVLSLSLVVEKGRTAEVRPFAREVQDWLRLPEHDAFRAMPFSARRRRPFETGRRRTAIIVTFDNDLLVHDDRSGWRRVGWRRVGRRRVGRAIVPIGSIAAIGPIVPITPVVPAAIAPAVAAEAVVVPAEAVVVAAEAAPVGAAPSGCAGGRKRRRGDGGERCKSKHRFT